MFAWLNLAGQNHSLSAFALVLAGILLLPRLMEKLGLPGLIGLILAGLLLGDFGLGVISDEHPVATFLADKGKLMLMFFAGLEIDMKQFSRTKHHSLLYGLLTFLLPLGGGILLARAVGMDWNASVLIGSLLASHTLLALPVLTRLRLTRHRAATVTIGATIFTDVAAMITLAICLSLHTIGLDARELALRLTGIAIYIPLLLVGTRWLSRHALRRLTDSPDGQTTFMLLVLTVSALGAELIHLEGIIGAFVAGLAVGDVVGGVVRRNLETLGNTLFIPVFFVLVGTLIDPTSFLRMTPRDVVFVIALVSTLIATKLAAAWIAGSRLGYTRPERLMMWSLSVPQVAATLAAALVAHETLNADGAPLLPLAGLDAVLVLVATTSILGPILTQFISPKLEPTA